MNDFLRARYRLFPVSGEDGVERAQHLAREQTVECPPGIAPEAEERALGRVDRVEPLPDGGSQVTISYPVAATGGELLQLLNVLWGNVSLWNGVRLEAVDWPPSLLARFRGPAFGVSGLRRLCAAEPGRPLLATALKPMGSTVRELARRAGEVALGGVDLVKDDHGLTDQEWAPFRERVLACAEMVHRANRATGGSTLYAPNLTGPVDRMAQRLEVLADAGCRAALITPLLAGLDTLRSLAETSGVALIAHPAFAGSFASSSASAERGIGGMAPGVLFGDIFRLAGADAVVFPNAEGRFPYTVEDCLAIESRLSAPMAGLERSFLMLGGGIDATRLERWIPLYGADTLYLLGGSLFARASPRDSAAELAKLVRHISPREAS